MKGGHEKGRWQKDLERSFEGQMRKGNHSEGGKGKGRSMFNVTPENLQRDRVG